LFSSTKVAVLVQSLARIALLICATLAAGNTSAADRVPEPGPRIWDVSAARFVSEPQLAAALAAVRYRLLGEVHDNPEHHLIRARLIAAIAAAGVRPAVVFEQFDLDRNAALVAAEAAGANAEGLANAGRLDRKGWIWPMHKPLLEVALRLGLPVRAGNVSREMLRGDLQAAVDKDTGAIWYARLRNARWTEEQDAALRTDIVDAHCGKIPLAIVPRLVLAQRVRDAAMAQALVDDATPNGAILVAGNGHVRADLGVPVYLHASGLPDAGARSISLGLIEVAAEEERAADFPQRLIAAQPGFDYVWLTRPAPREDPCASIGEPSR
jgi:uncharacterized iron-regulated protein